MFKLELENTQVMICSFQIIETHNKQRLKYDLENVEKPLAPPQITMLEPPLLEALFPH